MRTTRRPRRTLCSAAAPRAGRPLSPRAGVAPAPPPVLPALPAALLSDAAILREITAAFERLRRAEARARARAGALERRAWLLAAVDDLLEADPQALADDPSALLSRVATRLLSAFGAVRVDLRTEDGPAEPCVAVRASAAEPAGWHPDGAPVDGIVIPMTARGRTLGVMTVAAGEGRAPGADDVELAREVARRTAVALDNARRVAQAGARARCREQALAAVCHELRGPLQVISIASGALLRAWPADPALAPERGQISVIAQSAGRLRRLACDLVDTARMDAECGSFSVAPEPVDAGAMLHAAAQLYRAVAAEKGVALEVASAPAAAVLADEARVHQVLANLVTNAVRHTPRGGTITLRAEPADDEVRFCVEDTGCGIAPEHLPRVFERFWRGERARGGAGLGLAISRAIVQGHGGTLRADSRPGQGAAFTFTLPRAGAPRPGTAA